MLCQPCNCLFYHLHDVLSIGGDYRLFLQFTMEINMPGFGEGILPSAPSQTALPLLADFLLHAFHFISSSMLQTCLQYLNNFVLIKNLIAAFQNNRSVCDAAYHILGCSKLGDIHGNTDLPHPSLHRL